MNDIDHFRLSYQDVQRIRRREKIDRLITLGFITAGCLIVAVAALISNLLGLP